MKRPTIGKREGSILDKTAFRVPNWTTKGILSTLDVDLIATGGEFVGTVLFLLVGLGSVTNALDEYQQDMSKPQDPGAKIIANFYVSAAFGFSLYATATIFYRFTGSIFNPSVALALFMVGVLKPLRFVLVCTAQMIGGIVANAILAGLTPGELKVNLELGTGTNRTQGLFIEMFTTGVLCLSVLMIGAEKHLLTPHAPLAFAFTLMSMMMFSIGYTGTGMNVARAFGSACFNGFQTYHWIYWLGPSLGAIIASVLYLLLKAVRYWDVNPGQDSTAPFENDTGPRPDMHSHQSTRDEGLDRLAERQV